MGRSADVVVFAGPSLAPTDRQAVPGLELRGPAACGDVARAAAAGARAIGLIDGLFETTLSPWHKELLWVMSKGVRVFGAASIGALRAVELRRYGMVGVGEVFQAYCDGRLTDDDEVAVLHGPADIGYVAVTEAMVNVRWTLAAARDAGVIAAADADTLTLCAKRIFFKQRTWPAIWQAARGTSGIGAEAAAAWVGRNRVNVKQRDARALLALLATDGADAGDPAPRVPFVDTVFWERMRTHLGLASQ